MRADLFERGDRLFGAFLVAGDVGDLVEIGRADQKLRVGRIRAAGMQGDVALGRADRSRRSRPRFVIGIGRHDQRLARPFGIGMLALDFLEFLGGVLDVLAFVQQEDALVIELVGRLVGGVVLLVAEQAANAPSAAASEVGRRQDAPARTRTSQRPLMRLNATAMASATPSAINPTATTYAQPADPRNPAADACALARRIIELIGRIGAQFGPECGGRNATGIAARYETAGSGDVRAEGRRDQPAASA